MAFNGGSTTFLAPILAKLIVVMGIKAALLIVGIAVIVIGIVAAIGLQIAPVGYIPEGWSEENSAKIEATQLESLKPNQVFKTRGYWHLFFALGFFPTKLAISSDNSLLYGLHLARS